MEMSEMPSSAQEGFTRDEVREDLMNEMWSEYLKSVEDYDKRITDGWKEDANGVLVFTGLFSAVVAAFIIESYKLLSTDSGSQTVFLLGQLSQQFAGFANGTNVQPKQYPSSPPSTSIICVNVLWLLSLLLSTTCALFATLMQRWARVYIELPQFRSVPTERARVRSFLFLGIEKYLMHAAVEIAPTLLHLSVFLFYIGLVVFFFTIFKTVAVAILIAVGLFGLAYFALTILPCLDPSCPYRTPMTIIWWYLWHACLYFGSICLRFLARRLHDRLVPYNFGDVTSLRQRILTWWLHVLDGISANHWKRLKGFLKDRIRGTVVKYALEAPEDTDIKALTWLFQLPALAENSKIQKFVACIPGETVIQLLSNDNRKISFRHHLTTLLRSCAPGAVGLDEDMRRRRLLVCLDAVHRTVKALMVSPSLSMLDDVRSSFANIALMRPLWADSDPSIRVTARSICALFARQLLRKPLLGRWELEWLQEVMDKPLDTIGDVRDKLNTVDRMNVDSFVNGVLSHQVEDLPDVQATSFKETLKVLMNTYNQTSIHTDTFEEWLSSLIQHIEQEDASGRPDRDNIVDKLRRMLSSTTSRPPSQASST